MMLRAVPPLMRPMVTHRRADRRDLAADDGLHLVDELRRADDRIDGEVRMRAVSRGALDRHVERIGRGHHRLRMPADGAGGERRPVVKAEDGVGLRVERARVQHRARAGRASPRRAGR